MNVSSDIELSVPKFFSLNPEGCPEETDNISIKLSGKEENRKCIQCCNGMKLFINNYKYLDLLYI